jgi:hypothetical protein
MPANGAIAIPTPRRMTELADAPHAWHPAIASSNQVAQLTAMANSTAASSARQSQA